MLFKDKLKELRKNKNISQYDLAKELNISRSVVAKWETGLTLPNEELIESLIEYFGVKRTELFSDEKTDSIIVKKNASIKKLKKVIVGLTVLISILASIICINFCINNITLYKSIDEELEKLGDLENVNIYLKDEYTNELYLLDSGDVEYREILLNELSNLKYKTYPKKMMVEPFPGQHSIVLEGDVSIIINRSYVVINGKFIVVKKFKGHVDSILEKLAYKILAH